MKSAKIAKELKRIAEENGGMLQPAIVVQEARPKTSPLHKQFNWDDTEAAHQFRLWQARHLISVTVELIGGDSKETEVFVSLKRDRAKDGGGYRVMTDVLTNAELRRQMLSEALEELNYFTKKYQHLRELAAIFSAAKKIRRKAA